MADQMVLQAQKWYNETYVGKSGYVEIAEDGITGNGTCKALVRALQIELGLSSVDGVIGQGTVSVCPTIGPTTTNTNLIKIVQCGFYCKGYSCGGITGVYGDETIAAAQVFRTHVGFDGTDGTMPPKFLKALLNTDAYVQLRTGKDYIREAQQELNRTYIHLMSNMWYIPTNGIPDRNMMKAIIAALQYEESGKSMTGVDGIYGNNTLEKAPLLNKGTTLSEYVKIAKMCLMCMGMGNPGLTGTFDNAFRNKVIEFQDFYCLSSDSAVTPGVIGKVTWASLLSSKGYSARNALACDCSTQILTESLASALAAKYKIVGRYLTGKVGSAGKDKSLSKDEISLLINYGMRIFPIYQDGGATLTYFNATQGAIDAEKAITAAKNLEIPPNTIIYYAVDYDFTTDNINDYLLDHFKAIINKSTELNSEYRIGIYGSRNVCTTICNAGYACSSFVSDMSTGFSGNLGFPLPSNWAFDQFYEYTETTSDGTTFAVDKNSYSGRDNGFGADNYCGGNGSTNSEHNLYLKSDGYYTCLNCGYRAASPFLEDKEILDSNDYLIVSGLTYAYFIYLLSDKMRPYFYDFMYKIYEIRTKDKYNGKYSLKNTNGNCIFIEPSVEHTGLVLSINQVANPVTITSDNFDYYAGIYTEILSTISDVLFGIAMEDGSYLDQVGLAMNDYVENGNLITSLCSMLAALADEADVGPWSSIISLLQLGANITEIEQTCSLEIGDIVIAYNATTSPSFVLYIVFDSNKNFKTCYII